MQLIITADTSLTCAHLEEIDVQNKRLADTFQNDLHSEANKRHLGKL